MAEHEKTNDPYLAANAGHESTLKAWEDSDEGKAFVKSEQERVDAEKARAKAEVNVDEERESESKSTTKAKAKEESGPKA